MSNKDRSKQTSRSEKQQDRSQARDSNRTDSNRTDSNRTDSNRGDKNRDLQQNNNGGEEYRSTDLRDSPMMAHLLDALEQGQDIGHYGRLTFVMVARHFLSEDELVNLLENQPGMDEKEARAMVLQVKSRGYNPPKRERILQWMEQQDFPICPTPDDPNGCNVYRELQFPDGIYDQIDDFWEEKVEAQDEE